VHRTEPIVVPAFVGGQPPDVLTALRANFHHAATPITITFGPPLALDEYRDAPPGRRTSLRIAQAIRAEIERLGAIDRRQRAAFAPDTAVDGRHEA
jgi:hypothetical protein